MSCINHLSFSVIRNGKKHLQHAINQEKAIRDCLICRDRLIEIELHHVGSGFLKTSKEVLKCPICKPRIDAMIGCAKMGHIYEE